MTVRSLCDLAPGARGTIVALEDSRAKSSCVSRLMEMGLTVGADVEVTHEAPFGGTIAVTVRGSLIALGREDARAIKIEARPE